MYINQVEKVPSPIKNPQGETVYELIGNSKVSGNTSRHSVAVIVMPPGSSSQPHYHKIGEETYYILTGSAKMVIDDHEFDLMPGQACLIQQNERHQIANAGKSNLDFIAVCAPAWTPGDSYPTS